MSLLFVYLDTSIMLFCVNKFFNFIAFISYYWILFRRCSGVEVLTICLAISLSACSTIARIHPAPDKAIYQQAKISGFHHIRSWGDELPPFLESAIEQRRKHIRVNPSLRRRNDVLALSGGGADGAYGAGFLKGWTDRGDRPEFTLVTGVSTGALIAPFAYLGSEYDDVLKRFYTETKTSQIISIQPLSALFGGAAVGDSTPLKNIIEEEVNSTLLRKIAAQHKRGRLLLIGTTNLDAQRQMIWNIGAIASSGHKGAAKLIQKILLASTSIPGVFPPVQFDVMIDGKRYQELHVDGGVTHEIFAYPPSIKVKEIERRLGINPKKTFWLLRNTKINAEYKSVKLDVTTIAERSISTLIKYQGRGDLIELERLARRDGFAFRLTSVPEEFAFKRKEIFDPVYMGELYKVGYSAGLSGSSWRSRLGDQFTLKPSH